MVLLDFNSIGEWLTKDDMRRVEVLKKDKRYNMAKISDYIRVSILKLHGGMWMDLDTIITSDNFEREILYNALNAKEDNTIFTNGPFNMSNGNIFAKLGSRFISEYKKWLDNRVDVTMKTTHRFGWDYLANAFSNPYLKDHQTEFNMIDIKPTWPELIPTMYWKKRPGRYREFYFTSNGKTMGEIPHTSILILHNSWTPQWYKKLTVK